MPLFVIKKELLRVKILGQSKKTNSLDFIFTQIVFIAGFFVSATYKTTSFGYYLNINFFNFFINNIGNPEFLFHLIYGFYQSNGLMEQ